MPTLLIADDHPLFRDALRTTVLRIWPQARIHEAESAEQLYALTQAHGDADLLLLDLRMPGQQGFEALRQLRLRHPQLPVAVVSADEDAQTMRCAMEQGALGYLPKSTDAATLAQALQGILDGEPWFPPDALQAAAPGAAQPGPSALADLTPQQTKVLQMAAAGRLNKQIAHELGTSEATVKAHMSAILRKLGASNRTEAVTLAQRWGLSER
ncbi:response regulator transcription factor [Vandammella animalimorsus]|uniref:DNA-binding response regulator n=1 Tax=Vandammella animalimorsus TaxID=2029117 RepID=A0A2A2A936_9BURK|nr:response regulator transcription factor [Vandammella animalimorsus]PAT34277.1 DNA-binding response regulator [Vandammella animalimorsus]